MFIEDLFKRGESDYIGRCALHGWIWMYPHLIPGGAVRASDFFPLAKGALVGWTKLEASSTVDAAAFIVIGFYVYWRPSEGLEMMRDHVMVPARTVSPKYRRWCLVFCPHEELRMTKTSTRDDSVLVVALGREWVADVLGALYMKRRKGELLFDLSLSKLERLFRRCSLELGLKSLRPSPHSLRHGGPSADRYNETFSIAEVKRRGRWESDASVARYERHAKLLKQLSRLTAMSRSWSRVWPRSCRKSSWLC